MYVTVTLKSYRNQSNNLNYYIFAVEGHCSGITSGYHTLNLYIETCLGGRNYKDTATGWSGNTNRLIIEEFRLSSNIIGGKHISIRIFLVKNVFWFEFIAF